MEKLDNYHGISLQCMMVKRNDHTMQPQRAINPHLRWNQNVFQERETIVVHILALKRIIEEVEKNKL